MELNIRMIGHPSTIRAELEVLIGVLDPQRAPVEFDTAQRIEDLCEEARTWEEKATELESHNKVLRLRIEELESHLAHATRRQDGDIKPEEIRAMHRAPPEVDGPGWTNVDEAMGLPSMGELKAQLMRAIKLPVDFPNSDGSLPTGTWRMTPKQHAKTDFKPIREAGGWFVPVDGAGEPLLGSDGWASFYVARVP